MALGKSLEVRLFLKVLLKVAVAVGQWLQSGGRERAERTEGREAGREHTSGGTEALLLKNNVKAKVQTLSPPPTFLLNCSQNLICKKLWSL